MTIRSQLMLNSIDVKDLELYQQIVIYVIPVITNMGFINILVVVVRLYWFEKQLKGRRWFTIHTYPCVLADMYSAVDLVKHIPREYDRSG